MGAWGTGLYQNDMGLEIKDDYKNKLRAGKSEDVALSEILQEYKEIMLDEDDKFDVLFALADTMWNLGRLTNDVKNKVLDLISQECVEERWGSQKEVDKRKDVLRKLEKKLMSEMGKKKKISVHKPYVTSWRPGDVYIMEIENPPETAIEYKGWYIVIYVYEVNEYDFELPQVYDLCPLIYIMLSPKEIQSVEDIFDLKCCCSINNRKIGKKRYQYTLGEISERKMPKNIKYLGSIDNFKFPTDEYEYDGMGSIILWYHFVEDAISGYKLALRE